MKKAEMIQKVNCTVEKIRHLLKNEESWCLNIQAQLITNFIENTRDCKVSDIKIGYNWINKIYSNEYKILMELRKELPEERWQQYTKYPEHFKECREVHHMQKLVKELNKALRSKKPNIFLKNYKKEDKKKDKKK